MHGGKSTGPKTQAGIDRIRRARTKHGLYRGPNHPDFPPQAGPLHFDRELAARRRSVRESIKALNKFYRDG